MNTLSDKKGSIAGLLIMAVILWWLIKNKWSAGTGWKVLTVLIGLGVASSTFKLLQPSSATPAVTDSPSDSSGDLASDSMAVIKRVRPDLTSAQISSMTTSMNSFVDSLNSDEKNMLTVLNKNMSVADPADPMSQLNAITKTTTDLSGKGVSNAQVKAFFTKYQAVIKSVK